VSQPAPAPPTAVRALGYTAAAWCLFFAAVSAWQVVAGPPAGQRLRAAPTASHGVGARATAQAARAVDYLTDRARAHPP
jgi:hypothetical protein